MKKLAALAAMAVPAFCVVSFPTVANALCLVHSALPIRVSMSNTGTATIYFRPGLISPGPVSLAKNLALLPYYWTANASTDTTVNAAMVTSAGYAVAHQTPIAIYGNADSCPAPGSNGSIGTITFLSVNP